MRTIQEIVVGDCLEKMKLLRDCCVDAMVTDPPAGISFMSRKWDDDKGGRDQWIAWLASVMVEAKRVLKPGGWFVAVREPVESKLRLESKRAAEERARTGRRLYTLEEYQRFFAAAGLALECKAVHLSSGLKFFFAQMFNGLTHSRYALLAQKPAKSVRVELDPKAARRARVRVNT